VLQVTCLIRGLYNTQYILFVIRNVLKHYAVIIATNLLNEPIPVAVRSKAWVCGRSLARIVGSNHAGGTDVCLL
jgi:hypothetical protein